MAQCNGIWKDLQQSREEGIIAGIRIVEKTTGRKMSVGDVVGNGRQVGVMEKE